MRTWTVEENIKHMLMALNREGIKVHELTLDESSYLELAKEAGQRYQEPLDRVGPLKFFGPYNIVMIKPKESTDVAALGKGDL